MRILQIVPYYPPAWGYGGPPRVMSTLAAALVKRGHMVTVYTTDAWDEARRVRERERVLNGVQVIAFRNVSNRLAWRHKAFLPMGLVPHLQATAAAFDIVHVSAVRSFLHARIHRVLRAEQVPYVVDAHGALPKPVGWRRMVALIWDPLILTPFLQGAGALLAQTEHEADLYRSYAPGAPVVRVPLPIDLDELRRPIARGLLRQRLGVKDHTFVVLFLGRVEHRKGLHFLVDAFGQFAREVRDSVRLAIVGRDSGGLDQVRTHVARRGLDAVVTFVGPLYGDERLAAYLDADVFVLTPPYWEETSLAALEACATATPCVLTPQAEIPGLDAAGGGVTVQYGDVEALAQTLLRLARDRRVRDDMGKAAASHVHHRFSANFVAEFLEGVYRTAMARRDGT